MRLEADATAAGPDLRVLPGTGNGDESETGRVIVDGEPIAYSTYGCGPRSCLLLHGVLMSQRMQRPLARELARTGMRTVTMDLMGHGLSGAPLEKSRYTTQQFARQVLAVMDQVGLDQTVVFGTSVGASTALEVAFAAPQRVRGMVLEMPALDHAMLGAVMTLAPLCIANEYVPPVMTVLNALARAIPRRVLPRWVDVGLDVVRQDPAVNAAIALGLTFSRVAPYREQRRDILVPSLVIGHDRDVLHPLADARALAQDLPNSRFVKASSLVELRLFPNRLTCEIKDFMTEAWMPRARDVLPTVRGLR